MSYVTTRDGVRLYAKDWGSGRPVVMMHGWPLSSDTFDDLGMAIAGAGMRAIAYDRRGFGRSDQPWDGYDYDSLSDDLANVLEAVGATDAAILGFSMGGGEVARYMSRHKGAKVSRAILVASIVPYMLRTADNPHGVDQPTFDGIAQALKDDRAKFWSGFFKNFYGGSDPSQLVSQEVLEWSGNLSMMASLNATLACAESFAGTDFRPELKSFTVPTLIIHGTSDKIVPIDASGRAAAKRIVKSTLIEYDGAGHGLFASHKQRLIDDVMHFLRS
jgi:pimeloyl-ACP methyl ester carboxylesterase